MQPRDFVLFAHGACNGIDGRTKLQKIVYFLSVFMNEDMGYHPHFYGPYSPMVAEVNAELKELGYLRETASVYGYNHKGFEMTRYDYELTDDGKTLLERKKKQYGTEWDQITSIADKMKSSGTMDYMELAMSAKVFMICDRKDGPTSKQEIKTIAASLGWSIDDNGLEKAISFLEEVALVQWN